METLKEQMLNPDLSSETKSEIVTILQCMKEASDMPGAIERQRTVLTDAQFVLNGASNVDRLVILCALLLANIEKSPAPYAAILAIMTTVRNGLAVSLGLDVNDAKTTQAILRNMPKEER